MKWIHASDIRLNAAPIASGSLMIDRKTEYHEHFLDLLMTARQSGADLLVITGRLFDRAPGVREMIEAEGAFASLGGIPVILFPYTEEEYEALNVYPWPSCVYLRSAKHRDPVLLKAIKCRVDFAEEGNPDLHSDKVRKGTVRLLFLAPGENSASQERNAADGVEASGFSGTPFPEAVFGAYAYTGIARESCVRLGERVFAPGPFSAVDFRAENRGGFLYAETGDGGRLKVEYTPHEAVRELRFSVGIRGSMMDERLVGTLRGSGDAGTLFARFSGELVKEDEAAVRRMALSYGLRALTEEEESLKEI